MQTRLNHGLAQIHFALCLMLVGAMFALFPAMGNAQTGGSTCGVSFKTLTDRIPNIPALDTVNNVLNLGASLTELSDSHIVDQAANFIPQLNQIDHQRFIQQYYDIDKTLKSNKGQFDIKTMGILGGSTDQLLDSGLSDYDAKLRTLHEALAAQRETKPQNDRQAITAAMNQITELTKTWPAINSKSEANQNVISQHINGFLEETKTDTVLNKSLEIIGKAINPASLEGDIINLLKTIKGVDLDKMAKLKGEMDEICSYLPRGDIKDVITNAVSAYESGDLSKVLDTMIHVASLGLQKLIDKIDNETLKKASQTALNHLSNKDVDGAISALSGLAIEAAFDAIGGFVGALGDDLKKTITSELGGTFGGKFNQNFIDPKTGQSASGLGNFPGGGGVNPGGTDPNETTPPTTTNSGDDGSDGSPSKDSGGWADKTFKGFFGELKGKIPLCDLELWYKNHEKNPEPIVDCDGNTGKIENTQFGSKEFKNKVKEYFEYQPPADNRAAYTKHDIYDYTINKPDESPKNPVRRMKEPNCLVNGVVKNLLNGDGVVNEPCQDNRWRDACLLGPKRLDIAYSLGEVMRDDEEPLAGVAGASPIYDKNSSQLNCVVPLNTERKSPLEFDNGWRYRNMCPGSSKLRRVQNDQQDAILDMLRGEYGCLSPLPKCEIKNDMELGNIEWKNKEYKTYMKSFGNSIVNGIRTLVGNDNGDIQQRLKNVLSDSQYDNIKKLMKSDKYPAPECKPAYWVRLMLDSCANQYILNNAMKPDMVFNPDGQAIGNSPRMCQPFKAKRIQFGQEEYEVADYIKRSHKGLLHEDYMPYIEYDRHEGDYKDESAQYRKDNWPERKITWKSGLLTPNKAKNYHKKGYNKIPGKLSINDYVANPVERIIDPLHPFSPRYDIASTVEEVLLTDRTLFGDATESKARYASIKLGEGVNTWIPAMIPYLAGGLKKYSCSPERDKKGYFQFGASIYCSSVPVDLLRFRYKDYRLCMGCQIDTNERAFWEEYETNRKYYQKEYCRPTKTKDGCDYGDEDKKQICGGCGRRNLHIGLFAAATAGCALGLTCEEAKKEGKKVLIYTEACLKCNEGARAESLERTRMFTNEKKEPEWGPSAVGKKSWPVCSTQFYQMGDKDLCEKAKEEYSCDKQGDLAETDPNIAAESKEDAEQCIKKDIDKICHDVAKPVYSVNFLKIRTRKGNFKTDDEDPGIFKRLFGGMPISSTATTTEFSKQVEEYQQKYTEEDPAQGYGFREHFGNHRPYMRWWDTGNEAFQVADKPDYWCDWGANDSIIGVGRDYNSIHGKKSQLCRYGGGGGIGDSCFTMQDWKDGKDVPNDRKFESLAGSEWAELKLYQANCFRNDGLNCLCQHEKIFKNLRGEDYVLETLGTQITAPWTKVGASANNEEFIRAKQYNWPLSWRGYVSTPPNRDTTETSPAISVNQQFPYLFGQVKSSAMIQGLDNAQTNDIVVWPAQGTELPHIARVLQTHNINDYGSLDAIPGKKRWVVLKDVNNGKYLDACGITSKIGRGEPRTIYPTLDDMPAGIKELIEEQISATYYCEDPDLGECVAKDWDSVSIYRPANDADRTLP